jgi:hypothetical protein
VNTAGRDPLDRVEVGPRVRGEGRLVDRGSRVQALGRGDRVQSLAETAQARTDSALSALVGGEMDRVTERLHIDGVVLLVNAGQSHVLSAVRPGSPSGHGHQGA